MCKRRRHSAVPSRLLLYFVDESYHLSRPLTGPWMYDGVNCDIKLLLTSLIPVFWLLKFLETFSYSIFILRHGIYSLVVFTFIRADYCDMIHEYYVVCQTCRSLFCSQGGIHGQYEREWEHLPPNMKFNIQVVKPLVKYLGSKSFL